MKRALIAIACTLSCNVRLGDGTGEVYVVGAAGGKVATRSGLVLDVPRGAVFSDVQIRPATGNAPEGARSQLFVLEPQTLSFGMAASISLPWSGTESVALYWSNPHGGYARIPSTMVNGRVVASIMRLGSGYLGEPPATRTVQGRLSTVFQPETGAGGVRGGALGPPQHVTGLWVFDQRGNPMRYPVVENADFTFSVADVPAGTYFLEVDTLWSASGYSAQLYAMSTSTPDLSMISTARPDIQLVTKATPITFDISNLVPWVLPAGDFTGDQLMFASSSAAAIGRARWRPSAGATAVHTSLDWNAMSTQNGSVMGLPDAAKGDAVWVYQRSTQPLGAGVAHRSLRGQRLSTLTLQDGVAANLSLTLSDLPQTGHFRASFRGSAWAAMLPDIAPSARFGAVAAGGASVLAFPGSITFPDLLNMASTSLIWVDPPNGADVDYGDVAYGQFLGPNWTETRLTQYGFDVQAPSPSGAPVPLTSFAYALEAMPVATPAAPLLGPPHSPRIAGRDAFVAQTGVSTTPAISWSPPSLGTATSYQVTITPVQYDPNGLQSITITVHGATSLMVPPGFLQAGTQYIANIGAFSAPWDQRDAPPLRTGIPENYAECVTAVFTP